MTLYEAISVRVSTRSFDGAQLTPEQLGDLEDLCKQLEEESTHDSPFGNKVRLAVAGSELGSKPVRMGTYGLIANASGFVVPAVARAGKLSGTMEDVGWTVEKLVLELTARGYATCWIGGVFSRSRAAEVVQAKEDELVPAIIAFGWPADKRKLADRVVTASARARTRKPLEEIAFDLADERSYGTSSGTSSGPLRNASSDPLRSASSGRFDEPWLAVLRAVQETPSASNKQPWRLVRIPSCKTSGIEPLADEWMLFLDEDKIYNNGTREVHLQNLDLGIAMRHFQIAAEEKGLAGRWIPISRLSSGAKDNAGLKAALDFGQSRGWTACALWS